MCQILNGAKIASQQYREKSEGDFGRTGPAPFPLIGTWIGVTPYCQEFQLPDGRPTIRIMKSDIKQLASGEVGESRSPPGASPLAE